MTDNPPNTADRLLRVPDVTARTGLARSTIYDHVARGKFPRPVKLGPRVVAWRECDISRWIESLPEATTEAGGG